MRWKNSRRSSNVEDRRGMTASRGAIGGGVGLVVVLVVMLLGGDPSSVLQLMEGGGPGPGAPPASAPAEVPEGDEQGQFLVAVLGMTEDVWAEQFAESGSTYTPPTMVLFDDAVNSACGYNTAATGPFYCPPDQKLYLDTSFFRELARMGGEGDFAQAYVIGHEVGHHIQTITGTSADVRARQSRSSQVDQNRLQVLMELQADCLAGVWAHHADRRGDVLEPGDVQEGMEAASAIGDDRLQRSAGRAVQPESFTHGTSEQRRSWLQRGLQSGQVASCDTFGEAGIRF